jgi:hypothetical protein
VGAIACAAADGGAGVSRRVAGLMQLTAADIADRTGHSSCTGELPAVQQKACEPYCDRMNSLLTQ